MTRAFSTRPIKQDGRVDLNEDNPWIRKIKLASNFSRSYGVLAIKRWDLWHIRVDTDIQWLLLDATVPYRDIINFEGKFFTADLYGVILGFDENSIFPHEVHSSLEKKVWEGERYFVESCGHLYMVVREFYCCPGEVHYDKRIDGFVKETVVEDSNVPVRLKVYKRIRSYQQSGYVWAEVNDMGGRVFFVSNDCSFSFSTQESEGLHGNFIIYVDEIDEIQPLNKGACNEEDNDNGSLRQIRNGKVKFFNIANGSAGPLELFLAPSNMAES